MKKFLLLAALALVVTAEAAAVLTIPSQSANAGGATPARGGK